MVIHVWLLLNEMRYHTNCSRVRTFGSILFTVCLLTLETAVLANWTWKKVMLATQTLVSAIKIEPTRSQNCCNAVEQGYPPQHLCCPFYNLLLAILEEALCLRYLTWYLFSRFWVPFSDLSLSLIFCKDLRITPKPWVYHYRIKHLPSCHNQSWGFLFHTNCINY